MFINSRSKVYPKTIIRFYINEPMIFYVSRFINVYILFKLIKIILNFKVKRCNIKKKFELRIKVLIIIYIR